MANEQDQHQFFADDLIVDTEMISSVLLGPVVGRVPTIGSRRFLKYEAVLTSGARLSAVVGVDHNAAESVPRAIVRMSPLGSSLSLAVPRRHRISKRLAPSLFL